MMQEVEARRLIVSRVAIGTTDHISIVDPMLKETHCEMNGVVQTFQRNHVVFVFIN
jgi:hypothetical protein